MVGADIAKPDVAGVIKRFSVFTEIIPAEIFAETSSKTAMVPSVKATKALSVFAS